MIFANLLGRYLTLLTQEEKKEFEEDDEEIFNKPFEEAIKYLIKRKPILYKELKDIQDKERQNYFWVKKASNLEMTKRIQEHLIQGLKKGLSPFYIISNLDDEELLGGLKESSRYWKVAIDMNLAMAQSRGNWSKMQELKEEGFKYARYTSIIDGRETHICHNMHNKVMELDDFEKEGLVPPLHFGCRSTLIQLSNEEVEEDNIKIATKEDIDELKKHRQKGFGYVESVNLEELVEKKEKIVDKNKKELYSLIEIDKGKTVHINIPNKEKFYDKDGRVILERDIEDFKYYTNEGSLKLAIETESHIGSEEYTGRPYGYIATRNGYSINDYLRNLDNLSEIFTNREIFNENKKTISVLDTLIENGTIIGGQTLHRYTTGEVLNKVFGVSKEILLNDKTFYNFNSKIELSKILKEKLSDVKFTDKGYTSTSYNKQINYFNDKLGYYYHWEIYLSEDTKGFLTNNQTIESEVILPRNSKFIIKDVIVSNPLNSGWKEEYKITLKVEVLYE